MLVEPCPTPPLEAKIALSTLPGGHFVDLGTLRTGEAEAAGRYLGIEAGEYDTLSDGQLDDSHIAHIGAAVADLAQKYHVTAIATTGSHGFCGHSDHIITHLGALDAQRRLAETAISVPIMALRRDGQGTLRVPVDAPKKLRALGIHRSQMPVDSSGALDHRFFQTYPHYRKLLEYETFDILPAQIGAVATTFAEVA